MTIERVNKEDEGTYACNASNVAGYDYKMVFLSILTQAPIFIEKPRDRTVSINQEVRVLISFNFSFYYLNFRFFRK